MKRSVVITDLCSHNPLQIQSSAQTDVGLFVDVATLYSPTPRRLPFKPKVPNDSRPAKRRSPKRTNTSSLLVLLFLHRVATPNALRRASRQRISFDPLPGRMSCCLTTLLLYVATPRAATLSSRKYPTTLGHSNGKAQTIKRTSRVSLRFFFYTELPCPSRYDALQGRRVIRAKQSPIESHFHKRRSNDRRAPDEDKSIEYDRAPLDARSWHEYHAHELDL